MTVTKRAKRCRHPKEAIKEWNVEGDWLTGTGALRWCSVCGSVEMDKEGWQHPATWEKKT